MVYIEAYVLTFMEQKLETQTMGQTQNVEVPKFQIVFEKEQTLRDCLNAFALKKGYTGNIDKLARNVIFSVDGTMLSAIKMGVAMLLDVIVKPTQDVRIIPAIKAG